MLRLVTLNVGLGGDRFGRWSDRLAVAADVIRRTNPDVALLQAVERRPRDGAVTDQAGDLAANLGTGWHAHFVAAAGRHGGSAVGTAWLSRAPLAIDRRSLTLLTEEQDPNPRVLSHAYVEGVSVWNAYFSWVEAQARRNVEETLEAVGEKPGAAVVAGDFNCVPRNSALDLLRRRGWIDVWKELRPNDDGLTFFENGRLAKRIDYVWASPALASRLGSIDPIAVDPGSGGYRVSDHAGLLVTFL
jgi:endonuclease/exonuclease/phosphatase family metal-dependent hydrolase